MGLIKRELRNQIRRTILHEYGHHVGLTERDLARIGVRVILRLALLVAEATSPKPDRY